VQQTPSSFSNSGYGYDGGGRLTATRQDTSTGCKLRQYTYDKASNRTKLATYKPASDGGCQDSSATARTWSYDAADRECQENGPDAKTVVGSRKSTASSASARERMNYAQVAAARSRAGSIPAEHRISQTARGDLHPESEQFAAHAPVSPRRALHDEAQHQSADRTHGASES
jgi:hypothetical protein